MHVKFDYFISLHPKIGPVIKLEYWFRCVFIWPKIEGSSCTKNCKIFLAAQSSSRSLVVVWLICLSDHLCEKSTLYFIVSNGN